MTIYALIDPRDGEPFYIGSTRGSLSRRLIGHMNPSKLKGLSDKERRLIELRALGKRALIQMIECTDDPDAEARWIKQYTYDGFNLLNSTRSGRGRNFPEAGEGLQQPAAARPALEP